VSSVTDYRDELHEAHKAARARMRCSQITAPRLSERASSLIERRREQLKKAKLVAREPKGRTIYDYPIGPRMRASTRMSMQAIQHFVALVYGVTREEIISENRRAALILPRHIAMYLCVKQGRSFPEVGRAFGNRDHTSVIHAFRKIGRSTDPKFVEKLAEIEAEVSSA